jgi:glycosyltransferase involved in cell wall biosynthesis
MAMGIPCVTTELANNALGAKPEEQILTGTTPEEIARQVERLSTDIELSKKISANGRAFVTANYDWKSATVILEKMITQTVDKK